MNCTSRWSFTKNHYMMHGQQNTTFCGELLHSLHYSFKQYHARQHGSVIKKTDYFSNKDKDIP